MASSLSNLVNNLSEGIHRIKCKFCERCGIKYKYCDCFLEYTNFKDDSIEYKCLCCTKNYQQKFDEKGKEHFLNTYTFSNQDNKKFILLLRKGAYPYEYMDHWEKFNERSLPEKEDFYSHIDMEDITDANYTHAKRVCKEYHDLYVQNDTLFLAGVLENFRNMRLEIYKLDPVKFFSAPGLAW